LLVDEEQGLDLKETFWRTGGAWALNELPAGHFKIQALTAEGEARETATLAEGQSKDGIRLEVKPRAIVRGQLVGLDGGKPVPGLRVIAQLPSSSNQFSYETDPGGERKNISDAEGRFQLEDVPLGRILVFAFPLDMEAADYNFCLGRATLQAGQDLTVPPIRCARRRLKNIREAAGDVGFTLKQVTPTATADPIPPGGGGGAGGRTGGGRGPAGQGRHHLDRRPGRHRPQRLPLLDPEPGAAGDHAGAGRGAGRHALSDGRPAPLTGCAVRDSPVLPFSGGRAAGTLYVRRSILEAPMRARPVVLGILTGLLAMTLAPDSQAESPAVEKIVALNKSALTAFAAHDHEKAKEQLMEAVVLGKENGLGMHAAMARTYLHLGVVYVDGFKDSEKGQRYFTMAQKVRSDIELTPALVTPTVKAAFEAARAGSGAKPPEAAKAAPPKAEEVAAPAAAPEAKAEPPKDEAKAAAPPPEKPEKKETKAEARAREKAEKAEAARQAKAEKEAAAEAAPSGQGGEGRGGPPGQGRQDGPDPR
jgi:hypothetical protein